MRLFNAFQVVILYAAWPFIINWLDNATFRWSGAAFWSAIVLYIIASLAMVGSVYDSFKDM